MNYKKCLEYAGYGIMAAIAGTALLRPERITTPNQGTVQTETANALDEKLALYSVDDLEAALTEPVYKLVMIESDTCGYSKAAVPDHLRLAEEYLRSGAIRPIRIKDAPLEVFQRFGYDKIFFPAYFILSQDNDVLKKFGGYGYNELIPDFHFRSLKKNIICLLNDRSHKPESK